MQRRTEHPLRPRQLCRASIPERVAAGGWARPVNSSTSADPTPEQLAERSQAGCLESFEQLVSRYESQVFNFLRQLTRNEHDAQESHPGNLPEGVSQPPALPPTPRLRSLALRHRPAHRRQPFSFRRTLRGTAGRPSRWGTRPPLPRSNTGMKKPRSGTWSARLNRSRPRPFGCGTEGFSIAEIARIMQTNQVHAKVLLHRARSILSTLLTARGQGRAPSAPPAGAHPVKITRLKAVL